MRVEVNPNDHGWRSSGGGYSRARRGGAGAHACSDAAGTRAAQRDHCGRDTAGGGAGGCRCSARRRWWSWRRTRRATAAATSTSTARDASAGDTDRF
jgi:hypothetical protein